MDFLSILDTMVIGSADGPTSIFLATSDTQMGMGVLIATIVVGLLLGFFGLKLMRILSAFCGLGIGAAIGLVIASVTELSGGAFLGIVIGCGVVLAVLFAIFKRVGAFFLTLGFMFAALLSVLPLTNITLIIALAVSVIFAILSAIFVEPFVIVSTGLAGGFMAGAAVTMLVGFEGADWLQYVLMAALAVVSIIIQFMMQSRKIGKKEKVFSEKFKEEASMESEVERARMILDGEDDVEDETDAEDDDDIEIQEIDIEDEE